MNEYEKNTLSRISIVVATISSALLTAVLTYIVNAWTISSQYEKDIIIFNKETERRFDEMEKEQKSNVEALKLSMKHSEKLTLDSLLTEFRNEEKILSLKRNEYYQMEMIKYLSEYNSIYFSLIDLMAKEYVNAHYAAFKFAFKREDQENNPNKSFDSEFGFEDAGTSPFDIQNERVANPFSKITPLLFTCPIYFEEETCKNIGSSISDLEKFHTLRIDFILTESASYRLQIKSKLIELRDTHGLDLNARNITNREAIGITNMVLSMMTPAEVLYQKKVDEIIKSQGFSSYKKSVRDIRKSIMSVFKK